MHIFHLYPKIVRVINFVCCGCQRHEHFKINNSQPEAHTILPIKLMIRLNKTIAYIQIHNKTSRLFPAVTKTAWYQHKPLASKSVAYNYWSLRVYNFPPITNVATKWQLLASIQLILCA